MNKKQKILTILGLILIFFLIGTPLIKIFSATPEITVPTNLSPEQLKEYYKTIEEYQKIQEEYTGALKTNQPADPSDVGLVQEKPVMFIQYIAATIGGYLVKMAAYLTNLSLELNFKILDADYNPYVINGWRISRDLANLGFVLFIIIIAIATILRYQEYAAKSTLAKLIAVALLVNFSLMGAGIFVDFSNMLTNFFIKGAAGGSASDLATTIVSSWNPGGFLETKKIEDEGGGFSITGLITGALKAVVAWIASLFFVIIFTLLMAFVLFALAIMFLIRFIALTVLLVLVPLACLFWVIPATKSLWEKWWNNFIRWVLFAPAASFFLFLAIKMTEEIKRMGEIGDGASTLEKLNQTATANGIKIESIANAGLLPQLANGVILIGFVLGGLIVANSLSITGAKTFYGWAQTAGKGVGAWAGRKGIRAATLPARSELGRKAIEGMQKAGLQRGFMGKLATAPLRYIGRGLSDVGVLQGEKLIKQAEGRQKGLSDKQLALRLSTLTREGQTAALTRLAKNKNLDMIPNLADYIKNSGTKKLFESYGQGKAYGDVEKTAMFDTATLNAKTDEERIKAAKEFIKKYSIKDYDKSQGNILGAKAAYGLTEAKHNEISKAVRESIFDEHPGAISKVRIKLKGADLNKFNDALNQYTENYENKYIDQEIEVIRKIKETINGKVQMVERPIKVKRDDATDQEKIKWLQSKDKNKASDLDKLHKSRKNLAGSLLGASYISPEGEATEETTI